MAGPTRYATRGDGSQIAYRVAGEGPIDLLFSVGISNCEVLWDHPASARFLDRLARFSRLIVFDFRGSGASDGLNAPGFPTWEDWTDDVLVVLDHLGSQQCALFVMGTAVPSGMIFAATHPLRTSALVLFQAVARPSDPAVARGVHEYISSGWGTTSFAQVLAPSMADDSRYLDFVARTQRLSATPRLAAALVRHLHLFDGTHLVPLIHAPTLVLHKDAPFAQDPADLVSCMNDARLIRLDTADDLLFGTIGSDVVADHVEEFLTGTRATPPPDRALATVFFSDIVESTRRAAELGDKQWRRVLDAHDSCVRDGLDRYGGRLIKTTGDGVLATFDGPRRAIECAKFLRKGLRDLDIDIRVGVHTGEVELRADDVGGIAVHLAARVAAKAAANEILVSSTVRDLVIGSDLRFSDRGVHTLKGVPEEWRLLAVE